MGLSCRDKEVIPIVNYRCFSSYAVVRFLKVRCQSNFAQVGNECMDARVCVCVRVCACVRACVCACACWSPQKGALLHMGKNITSPSTKPHADGRPTYSGVWPGSTRGSLTALSLSQCHAVFSTIPSTLAWVDQSPVSQRVS